MSDLQTKLENIKEDIADAIKQRDSLISGNNEILQSKLTELNDKFKEVEGLRVNASILNATAIEHKNLLDAQLASLEDQTKKLTDEKLKFVKEYQDRHVKLNEFEEKLNSQEIRHNERDFNLKNLSNELVKATDDHLKKCKELDIASQSLDAERNTHQELLINIEKKLDEVKEIRAEILSQRQAHAEELVAFNKLKTDADIEIEKSKADLEQAIKERETAQTLTIEAKRISADNIRKLEFIRKENSRLQDQITEHTNLRNELSKKETT